MQKVLHIYDHGLPLQSGYVFRSLTLRKAQERAGLATDAVTSVRQYPEKAPETVPDYEEFDGLRFYRTAPHGLKIPLLRELADIKALARKIAERINRETYDILHAHSPVLNYYAARLALLMTKKKMPLVYEIRAFWEDAAADHGKTSEESMRYRATKALETQACKGADHVFTICEGLKSDLMTRGIKKEKITVVGNTVDTEKHLPLREKDAELAAQLGTSDKVTLGFIGSFYKYEGLTDIPAYLKALRELVPNAVVLAVGGGPDEAAFKESAQKAGVSEHIIFTGRIPNEEIGRYYSLCDALVFPRRKIRLTETVTPLKPLECNAFEKIVFASDIGGHRELIRDGETGFLIPDFTDTPAAARKTADILADTETLERVRRQGREYVVQERGADSIVRRYAAFSGYASLAESA